MEEKKGLLSALAETLKQYEQNQADNKDSLAIALEEKLEEIEKMISSLSDRVDNLSSRISSIGDKVDSLAERTYEPGCSRIPNADYSAKQPNTAESPKTAEPVFDAVLDSAEADGNFHSMDSEEDNYVPELDGEIAEEEGKYAEEDGEDADTEEDEDTEDEEGDEDEDEDEEDAEGEEDEDEEEEDAESEEDEENTEDEEGAEEDIDDEDGNEEADIADMDSGQYNAEPAAKQERARDWYEWEYDYPAEYVDDLSGTMGINDKLEFVRELFLSDPMLFDSQMKEIDTMPNFKAIVQFFRMAHPEWDEASDTVYRFYMHIRRKFRS